MEKNTEPVLTVDLGNHGGSKLFYSWDELKTWVNQEEQFWAWVEDVNIPLVEQIRTRWKTQYGSIRSSAQIAETHYQGNPGQIENMRKLIQIAISNYRTNWLLSSTAEAKFLDELKNQNPRIALFALLSLTNAVGVITAVEIQNYRFQIMEGAFQMFLFKHGLSSKTCEAEKNAIQELRNQYQQDLTRLQTERVQKGQSLAGNLSGSL